ncbi:MAG: glucosamine-6-phosphate deaminase [Chloroflexi bacterium]|mgnify:CR=1 FL=1|nr:glucosamine-6-phosphate deaminase [Chloroflexota bacterium]
MAYSPEPTATIDQLRVYRCESPAELGALAADMLTDAIQSVVAERGSCNLIMATGNSQLPLYTVLRERDLPWGAVRVLHMDEYLGLDEHHSASFQGYMRRELADRVPLKAFYGIRGDVADPAAEIARYSELLRTYPADVCVLGIGENGHLAFNDPPADFTTDALVHIVTLDQVCRQQQVGEGHFASLDAVPKQALTLTVPALLSARMVLAIVPEARKAEIVRRTLTEPISPACPATILRRQAHAHLFLDAASASRSDDLLN